MRRNIVRAAVIGSGIMGGGIAALLAGAGLKVDLLDIVPFDLTDDEKSDPIARNRLAKTGLDMALFAQPPLFHSKKDAANISIGNLEDDFDRLKECDWICEVVVENLKIKQDLFKRIEGIRKPGTIVSSNTSGIPLANMSEGLSNDFKQHFLGTHFFNPVRWMHLLELIPGEMTLPHVLDAIAQFGETRLGKGITWAKDTPNFIANRIGIQGMGKIMQQAVENKMTLAEVDLLFGPAMGRPSTAIFGTADLVGLDTMSHVAKTSYDLCPGDERRDSFELPSFVAGMIDQGRLGNKTQKGFYRKKTDDQGKRIKYMMDPATGEYVPFKKASFPCVDAAKKADTGIEKIRAIVYGDDRGSEFAWECAADGLIYAANRIPEIADTIVEIDNAMRWGYAVEMGPFESWDALGVREAVVRMEMEGRTVPQVVINMLDKGNETFYKSVDGIDYYWDFTTESYIPVERNPSALSLASCRAAGKVAMENSSVSLIDIGDGIFCVEFHTKMNALNREIIEFIGEARGFVEENGQGIVIGNQAGGMPGAFSAGADLDYVLKLCKDKHYTEMDEFLKTAQAGVQAIRYSNIPVVAAPYGMTLGGGCEVCLGAADKIVAAADLMMGLVEVGVGLIPAGGGCMNLWKKFLTAMPGKVGKDTDLAKLFIPVLMNIAMATYSMSAKDAVANGHLSATNDRIVMNRDLLLGEAKKEVLSLIEKGYAPPAKAPLTVIGQNGQGMVTAQMFNVQQGGMISEHDARVTNAVAHVVSGGTVRTGARIEEETMLALERQMFVELAKEPKTVARIEHMLTTGKPLRN